MQYITHSASETQTLAQEIAREIATRAGSRDHALVVALEGDLGAGKTTFVQAFSQALGITDKVKSPTFNLVKTYHSPDTNLTVVHMDCYRLHDGGDLANLGFDHLVATPRTVILMEWAERVRDALPSDRVTITFDHRSGDERTITVQYP